MMCKSGLSHIITMDLHQKEIQGFFDCPVDNLRASPFLLQYIQESVSVFFRFLNCAQTKFIEVKCLFGHIFNIRSPIIVIPWLLLEILAPQRKLLRMLNDCVWALLSFMVNKRNRKVTKLMAVIRHQLYHGAYDWMEWHQFIRYQFTIYSQISILQSIANHGRFCWCSSSSS